MRAFTEHDVNLVESDDFYSFYVHNRTGGIRISADIRCAVGVTIPREALQDTGDEFTAAMLIRHVRRLLVDKLLENPSEHVVRPGEFIRLLSLHEIMGNQETAYPERIGNK